MNKAVHGVKAALRRRKYNEPICGVDFCDRCGDCLHCYGDGPCLPDGGDHSWVIYSGGLTEAEFEQAKAEVEAETLRAVAGERIEPGDVLTLDMDTGLYIKLRNRAQRTYGFAANAAKKDEIITIKVQGILP